MRWFWVICLVAGCDFAATAPAAGPGAGDDDDQGPSGTDAGATAKPECDVTGDPSLQLCVTFDHDAMVQDLSGFAHVVTEATNVTPIDRNGVSPAVALSIASRVHIAEDDQLDVAQMTIDLWIAPAAGAIGHRSWILDNNTQYFVTYEADGKVRCGIGSKTATSSAAIAISTWHHVACTYDLRDHELHVYVDGDRSGCTDINTGIPTGGTDGIAIGANYGTGGSYLENYLGGIDGVHLYGRAMSDAEICTAAGKTSCRSMRCDQGGPGGPGGGPGN
jgi:concanavalin A-like lectin/glucanase superfamily protein